MKRNPLAEWRMEQLRAANPRYNDWPLLYLYILRALPYAPKAPTSDQGALLHRAYLMMGGRPGMEWMSLLSEVSRELDDRSMKFQGDVSPWGEE